MSKRILNQNNCVFRCPSSPSVVFEVQQMNHHFHDGSGVALTTQTKISGAGICTIQTAEAEGTPVPCSFQSSSAWVGGVEFNKQINEICLLNEDATQFCPVSPTPIRVEMKISPVNSPISEDSFDGFTGTESKISLEENTDILPDIPKENHSFRNQPTAILHNADNHDNNDHLIPDVKNCLCPESVKVEKWRS